MSRERLAQMIHAHQDALAEALDSTSSGAEATILGVLQALDQGEITQGQAQRLLDQHALFATDEPPQAALYRAAAREIRQMPREAPYPAGSPPMTEETRGPSDLHPEDSAEGGAPPPRTQWYFCPHRQRFLVRGAQQCVLCEPPPQQLAAPPMGSLRAIFPMLDASGEPIPARTRTDEEREGAATVPPPQMAGEE